MNASPEIDLFVRQRRQARQLTLNVVAPQAGMSRAHLSRCERGERGFTLQQLLALSDILQCHPQDLFAFRGYDHPCRCQKETTDAQPGP